MLTRTIQSVPPKPKAQELAAGSTFSRSCAEPDTGQGGAEPSLDRSVDTGGRLTGPKRRGRNRHRNQHQKRHEKERVVFHALNYKVTA